MTNNPFGAFLSGLAPYVLGAAVVGLLSAWLRGADARVLFARVRNRVLHRAATDLDSIRGFSDGDFEIFCAQLLEREGYRTKVTRVTSDHGVDVLLEDAAGRRGVVQCKRWARRLVGRPVVQQIFGEMMHERAVFAAVLTTSDFTREARDWAQGKQLRLVDGPELAELATNHFGKPLASARFDSSDLGPCPRCGRALVERPNRRTGQRFFRCAAFPRCLYSTPARSYSPSGTKSTRRAVARTTSPRPAKRRGNVRRPGHSTR